MIREIKQLMLDFTKGPKAGRPFRRISQLAADTHCSTSESKTSQRDQSDGAGSRDPQLEAECREVLAVLGMSALGHKLRVIWNSRLRSSAGFASFPAWRIELNPRLQEFEGQVERTLKHELAHLVAFQRAGHTRIEPHGDEWRKACEDVGIPDERAHHHLPLPRNQVKRNFVYVCVSCALVVRRVRKFRRYSACRSCCSKHGDGSYDERFRFEQVSERNVARYQAILDAEARR